MPNPSLISRLEESTEGSRELDTDLFQAFAGDDWHKAYIRAQEPCGCPHDMAVEEARHYAPRYTTSLDAAIALVERLLPGWWWEIDAAGNATVFKAPRYVVEHAATPALALCLAALKAMEAKDGR